MNEQQEIYEQFKELVTMSPSQIEKQLAGEESNSVGQDSGDGESIGHKSGEKIIRIKQKNKADLTEADYEHMQKVVSYIKRHLAQKPGKIEDSRWLYSLKNWGHDAEKKQLLIKPNTSNEVLEINPALMDKGQFSN